MCIRDRFYCVSCFYYVYYPSFLNCVYYCYCLLFYVYNLSFLNCFLLLLSFFFVYHPPFLNYVFFCYIFPFMFIIFINNIFFLFVNLYNKFYIVSFKADSSFATGVSVFFYPTASSFSITRSLLCVLMSPNFWLSCSE